MSELGNDFKVLVIVNQVYNNNNKSVYFKSNGESILAQLLTKFFEENWFGNRLL